MRSCRYLYLTLALLLLLCSGCVRTPAEETWAIQEEDKFDPLEDPIFDILANALSRNVSVPAEPAEQDALVPFDEMVYVRPDAAALTGRLNQIAAAVRESTNTPGAAVLLLKEAGEQWDGYRTALNLARVHHDINTRDLYWADEYAHCTSIEGEIRLALAHVQGSAAALQEEARHAASSSFDQDRYVELQSQEQGLLNDYAATYNNAGAEYNGETIYYSDGLPYEAAMAWLDANGPHLGELYVNLVRIRNEIARLFGFSNYIEYYFADTSYTYEMIHTLLGAIRTYYAPLYTSELESYRNPNLQIGASDAIAFMRTVFESLDPQLNESMDLMEAYRLSSLADTDEKAAGAYTTYFADYGVPFICMRYDGSYNSFATLLHEFGHFNDIYRNPSALTTEPEITEIFSTALLLLCSDRYDQVFDPETAASCEFRELDEIFLTALEQGALLQFEMEAYTLPETSLNYETLCDIAERAWLDMGFPESPAARVSWVQTPHVFETPFYVLSYIVSGNVAMQMWELNGQDPAAGFVKYNELLEASRVEDPSFLHLVTSCGLASPFDAAEIARQADAFATQFSTADDPILPVAA